MIDTGIKKEVQRKMTEARRQILMEYPFYGYLAMHLNLRIEECGTAYTDMKRIVFDPEFAMRLSMEEMKFVFLHEVLHCVLNHCIRGEDKDPFLFNVACDIVVNSNIMYSMGVKEFTIDNEKVMHLAPDQKEGYLYNAEKVYEMLGKDGEEKRNALESLRSKTDDHDPWKKVGKESFPADQWKERAKKAGKLPGANTGMPPSLREYEKELKRQSKVNWRILLKDFLELYCDQYDYTFYPGDRRYAESEYVLPAFDALEGERLENIWFVVDTSGSISNDQLSLVMDEISHCLMQMGNFEAKLSFFDTAVTEPVSFRDKESLNRISPKGGGGTSFDAVFQYLKEHFSEELPAAIVLMTDGYAQFPSEEAALGVPVLWMMVKSSVKSPWGTCVKIEF